VQQRIGIAVPDGMLLVRNRHASQLQRPASFQAVRIVPNADAEFCFGRLHSKMIHFKGEQFPPSKRWRQLREIIVDERLGNNAD
jgi:hypothetical protein